ncbi:MAG: NAD(+)/NADH kinase [Pyrinomonadaceae bacterium]|nr:NAD(+)/NADH kinase [Pyrinomonadaceae bacterium]MCX7640958.1 NAD(+)/NADH kinase [Pyrinomonadaceae bacterium]MDW8305119.1 NAD(+)/NADH kinase [Acidobacteriota bacterium]
MQDKVERVSIIVKPGSLDALKTANSLAEWLEKRGIKLIGNLIQDEIHGANLDSNEIYENADLLIVLGGDGTILATARRLGRREVPVLGINYGSLGYLTEFRIEEVFLALEKVLAGDYEIDRRSMLTVELENELGRETVGRALNDVVVNKSVPARIIEIEVCFDEFFVSRFRADGLIVSTPTGSTAYNLSAGGPIIYPSVGAVVLTPICPFTLTNRPIVIPDSSRIRLRLLEESEGVILTLDGQVFRKITKGDVIHIHKSSVGFALIKPTSRNYFDVLRNKLKWGS